MKKIINLPARARIHFIGIGGSGCAGAAYLAKKADFQVSGCDLAIESKYLEALKKIKVPLFEGHDSLHLEKAHLAVVSPAVLKISPGEKEIELAKKRGILTSWQEFVGQILQKGKTVIAVAGTHGKTTTTALLGLALEKSGLDPTVLAGGYIQEWGGNGRFGNSCYFVCEADEYNENFLAYSPQIILLNNIEMDHPEFFKNLEEVESAFKKFIFHLWGRKILIVNADDFGVRRLLLSQKKQLEERKIKVIGYGLLPFEDFSFENFFLAKINKRDQMGTNFSFWTLGKTSGREENFYLSLMGDHQVYNTLAVLACLSVLNLRLTVVKKVLECFQGVKRRFDLVGEAGKIKIFDDYGHHPTQIEATLKGARQRFPRKKIWAVFEPHQISRLRLMSKNFVKALEKADQVIIVPVFWGREKKTAGLMPEDLVPLIGGKKAFYARSFEEATKYLAGKIKKDEIVVVFGAGKSDLLSQLILEKLKKGSER